MYVNPKVGVNLEKNEDDPIIIRAAISLGAESRNIYAAIKMLQNNKQTHTQWSSISHEAGDKIGSINVLNLELVR